MTIAKILGISGSLRQASFSTAVLRGLADHIADIADLTIHCLGDIPLYNQDLDTDTPPASITALRDAIAEADGVVIVSPEYNQGMPGMLKNALDWASRPYNRSAFIDKPVITATCSPSPLGGVRAQLELGVFLRAMPTRPVLVPQAVIGQVGQKIENGKLIDEAALTFLRNNVIRMIAAMGTS